MVYDREELFNLPTNEKLELVGALWDNIDEEFLRREMIKQGLGEEIEKRIKKINENPETLIPWEAVKKKMNK
jgi:putative addiction module component (TIGR02574 family)